jgi:hypothetical protein
MQANDSACAWTPPARTRRPNHVPAFDILAWTYERSGKIGERSWKDRRRLGEACTLEQSWPQHIDAIQALLWLKGFGASS